MSTRHSPSGHAVLRVLRISISARAPDDAHAAFEQGKTIANNHCSSCCNRIAERNRSLMRHAPPTSLSLQCSPLMTQATRPYMALRNERGESPKRFRKRTANRDAEA